jgi:hypothetical protein
VTDWAPLGTGPSRAGRTVCLRAVFFWFAGAILVLSVMSVVCGCGFKVMGVVSW